MNKKMITAVLSAMLLLTSCSVNININAAKKAESNTEILENNESLLVKNEIRFIDGIYGVYGKDNGNMNRDIIDVYKGKDDNHIDISVFNYGKIAVDVNDMEITRNKNGEVIATKSIGPKEEIWEILDKEQYLGDAKLEVTLKDNRIKLKFNKDLKVDVDGIQKVTEKEKVDLKVITEEEKQKVLNNILDSDFRKINEDIFEVIKDTPNYLVVRVKCYVFFNEENIRYYNIEGSESIGMYKYYNIDKRDRKVLELNDIIDSQYELNEYVRNEINEKHEKWDKEQNKKWEYNEFERIGEPEFFENYFLVDEEKKVVKIRCLGYPNEISGDLCVDVPFKFFKLNQ